jgi:hypothetical protein
MASRLLANTLQANVGLTKQVTCTPSMSNICRNNTTLLTSLFYAFFPF